MVEYHRSDGVPIGTKRPKIDIYSNAPRGTGLLGLTLTKSPSFAELIEEKLSNYSAANTERKTKKIRHQSQSDKLKASIIPAFCLQIGSWKRVASYDGDLVAKCYFGKQKLVWEVLNEGLKSKMEIQWPQISAIRGTFIEGHPDTLEIELQKPPTYFCESSPQPKKHTMWIAGDDFTGGQALIYKRHVLKFSEGTLEKHYEKLLQCDYRLHDLSHGPFPNDNYPFFEHYQFPYQIPLVRNFCSLGSSTQHISPYPSVSPIINPMNSDCSSITRASSSSGIQRMRYFEDQRTERPMPLEVNSIAHRLLGEQQSPVLYADEKSLLVKISSFGSALCGINEGARMGSTLEEDEYYFKNSNALVMPEVHKQVGGVYNLSGSTMEPVVYNDCNVDQMALLQEGFIIRP